MKPGVVRLVNYNGIIIFGRTGCNITRATPSWVMMDTWAQLVMLGKHLAQELNLTTSDLEPCPFTIITLVGSTERATSYTNKPLQLIFLILVLNLFIHTYL